MRQCFTKPYEHFGRDNNVKVDLPNYATKADLKNAEGINTSKLAAKSDFAKLVPVTANLSKPSDVVENDVVIKTVYVKLVAKVKKIDTREFVLKTNCNKDKSELEKKTLDTSGLVRKTNYNIKISEIENKIPSISSLATISALIADEYETRNVSSLVKKTDYNKKKLVKLNRKLLMLLMINALLPQNLIS